MINNRQGGRRRGRGGQRNPSIGGNNRQDNRQRGNAAQLLEKYKNMARDAQLAGDRVQSEYYLQFADHYFRVLGESRARFEDQRPQRGDDSSDEDDGDEDMMEAGDDDRSQRPERNDRYERTERPERGDRPERSERPERAARPERAERTSPSNGRNRSSRNGSAPSDADEEHSIALEVLPPAIGRDSDDADEAAAKPKRRTRKPRNDGDEADIAPAA